MTCEHCGTTGEMDNPVKPRRFSLYDREQDRTVLCSDCWRDVLRDVVRHTP